MKRNIRAGAAEWKEWHDPELKVDLINDESFWHFEEAPQHAILQVKC